MKKKSLIPGWLLVVDILYIICVVITYVKTGSLNFEEMKSSLGFLFFLPAAVAAYGLKPVIILNMFIIAFRFFQNRAIVKSNKFYTGQKKPAVVATPVNSTPAMTAPPAAPAPNKGEGHMELF